MDRCETCRFWNNSVSLDLADDSGRCVARSPRTDKRTGRAVWPFTEATDGCGEHAPIDDAKAAECGS